MLTWKLATNKILLATGQLTQPHNAKLQLDLNQSNAVKTPSNTGILTDVSTNVHQLDTASGISNQRTVHHQQDKSTHVVSAKMRNLAVLSKSAHGTTMRRTDQNNSSQWTSAIQSRLIKI
jgi:hypothetical protein